MSSVLLNVLSLDHEPIHSSAALGWNDSDGEVAWGAGENGYSRD